MAEIKMLLKRTTIHTVRFCSARKTLLPRITQVRIDLLRVLDRGLAMLKETIFPLHSADYLQNAYFERRTRNPQYSMRAMARDLSLSPSSLCEFLQGRTGLSLERVKSIAKLISLTDVQTGHFCDLVSLQFGRDETERESAKLRILKRCTLSDSHLPLENFTSISSWHHMVLLELIALGDQFQSAQQLADVLDLDVEVVDEAIERLLKLGLLIYEKGQLHAAQAQTLVGDGNTSSAIRAYHQQMLEQASIALLTKSVEERKFQSIVFSMRADQVADFYVDLEKMTKNLIDKYHDQSLKNMVCSLNTQWIPYNRPSTLEN